MPNWRRAYQEAVVEWRDALRRQRADKSTKLVRVPGTGQSYYIRDLDDDEIDQIALFEAEKETNGAINQARLDA